MNSLATYVARVWHQPNGWHWAVSGHDVQPVSGISGTFGGAVLESTERLAALDPAASSRTQGDPS